MATDSSDYGHFVEIEDAQTHELFHFVVGKARVLRFLGGRRPDTGAVPAQSSQAYAAAEAAAEEYFRDQGII